MFNCHLKFPSWPGGVPRQMNEVNLLSLPDGSQGGVVEFILYFRPPLTRLPLAVSEPLLPRHSLCSVWAGGEY
jgi:hypothetical protein